jgi:hypothetical protein
MATDVWLLEPLDEATFASNAHWLKLCWRIHKTRRGQLVNWEAVSAISEIVGAFGVVASLGYLAYQIRQNTKQLEQNERASIAAAVNVSLTNYRENRRYIYTSAEVSDICLKGMADPDALSDSERYRFRLLIQNLMDALWDMYSQTVLTSFSPETWTTQGQTVVERVFATTGGRWFWKNFCHDYSDEFRNEIDRILRSRPEGSKNF